MKHQRREVGRRFPDLGWAWPAGDLDLLIRAVASHDGDAALRAAQTWLSDHDIDLVGFREHRLLAGLSERFGRRLSDFPAQPRIAGLQRMLWTRSRLAARDAEPVLIALHDAGIPIMLMKGAARVAVEAGAERSRISHDIDLLVPPECMERAFECLVGDGWEPATGASVHFLRGRLAGVRALNFLRGDYGDIDLHQSAYHPVHADAADDKALWTRAVPAKFAGVPVLVPSTADRLALSIAHGSLDAHVHSDWLVDCDAAIRRDDLHWATFLSIVEARGLVVPAAIALSYLSSVIGSSIPGDAMDRVLARARARSFGERLSVLLQSRPRGETEPMLAMARGLAKLHRMRVRADAPRPRPDDLLRGRTARVDPGAAVTSPGFWAELPLEAVGSGRCRLRLVLDCDLPPPRRRFDFELRSPAGHIARLRYRKIDRREGCRSLVFDGWITIRDDGPLILEARPARYLRRGALPEDHALFGAVAFSILKARWSA